jgi:hypothetical protein
MDSIMALTNLIKESKLRELSLRECGITEKGAQEIIAALASSCTLAKLHLGNEFIYLYLLIIVLF